MNSITEYHHTSDHELQPVRTSHPHDDVRGLCGRGLDELPGEALGLVLSFAVSTHRDLVAAGRVSKHFHTARRYCSGLRLTIEARFRFKDESWAGFAAWLHNLCGPAVDALALHKSNADTAAVAKLVAGTPRLSGLCLSKSYGIDGDKLLEHLRRTPTPALRAACFDGLPHLHRAQLLPAAHGGALAHCVALTLTNGVLDVDFTDPALRFSTRLVDVLTSGALPQLTHLFLGGATILPPPVHPSTDEPPRRLHRRHQPLQVLEVTFLLPEVRQWLMEALGNDIVNDERTTVLDLALSPLEQLHEMLAPQRQPNLGAVKLAVSGAIDCSDRTKGSATPLHLAANDGDLARVEWLLRAGANTEPKDVYGSTPLRRAAERDHTNIVAALLRAGADPFAANHRSESPLFIAALKGNSQCVQTLLQAATTPGTPAPATTAATPVSVSKTLNPKAAAWVPGQAATVPVPPPAVSSPALVEFSKTRDADGFSPLHAAALRRSAPTLKALLQAGCSFSLRNRFNQTPLHLACRGGAAGIPLVGLLLDADPALLNAPDDTGATPLDVALGLGIGSHTSTTVGRGQLVDVLRKRGAVQGTASPHRKASGRRRGRNKQHRQHTASAGGGSGGSGGGGSGRSSRHRNSRRRPVD